MTIGIRRDPDCHAPERQGIVRIFARGRDSSSSLGHNGAKVDALNLSVSVET